MPWLAAGIGAVAGLAGGAIQSGAQDRATQAQALASKNALNFQNKQWQTSQTQMQPYMQAGTGALTNMQRVAGEAGNINPAADAGYKPLTGLSSPGQFSFSTSGATADPSYTWRLNQGLNAVNSSAAARGGFFSGNTGQALMDYGQGAASQEYQNQFGRYNQMLSNYMGQEGFNADQYNQAYGRQMGMNQNQANQWGNIAGMGQNAVNQSGAAGQNYASNAGNIGMNQANNAAAGYQNQGNIWGGVLSNASNQFMSAAGNQLMQNQMNQNPGNQTPTNYGELSLNPWAWPGGK